MRVGSVSIQETYRHLALHEAVRGFVRWPGAPESARRLDREREQVVGSRAALCARVGAPGPLGWDLSPSWLPDGFLATFYVPA